MANKRRTSAREFKVDAVNLVTEKDYSLAEAARSLGIGQTLLRSWKIPLENKGTLDNTTRRHSSLATSH